MRTAAILFALVAVAAAQFSNHVQQPQQQHHQQAAVGGGGGGMGGGGVGGGAGAFQPFQLPKPVNYGNRVYGRGHLNQYAIPPNPFLMAAALRQIQNFPGALIRLDLNGEISFTDRYGEELELVGPFGQEIELDR